MARGYLIVLAITVFSAYLSEAVPAEVTSCTKCKRMLSTVRDVMVDQLSTSQEGDELSDTCNEVPEPYQEFCENLMNSNMLEELSDSDLHGICASFGQCVAAGESKQDTESGDLVFSPELELPFGVSDRHADLGSLPCLLCNTIMQLAHTFLQDKSHQAMALNLLKSVCHFLPIFKTQCTNLVNKYGQLLINLAVHFINPQLCKTIHICTSVASPQENCRACRFGFGVVEDTLHDPALEKRLNLSAQAFCKAWLKSEANECEQLATAFIPELLHLLKKTEGYSHVCEEYGLCERKAVGRQ